MEAHEIVIAHKVQVFGLALYKHRDAIRKSLEIASISGEEDIEDALAALNEVEREIAAVR